MSPGNEAMATTGSFATGQAGSHNHPTVLPRPGGVIPGMRRGGGKVTHKLRRGGRVNPRKMKRGGRIRRR
jgi:hypothetical protein